MKVLKKFSIAQVGATTGIFLLVAARAAAQVVTGVPGSPDTSATMPESQSGRMAMRVGPSIEKEFDCEDLVVKRVHPPYPRSALRNGTEGWVVLSYTLDGYGRASEIQVMRSNHPGVFDRNAIDALKQWEFKADAKRSTCQLSIAFFLGAYHH
jgi:TonB family protein